MCCETSVFYPPYDLTRLAPVRLLFSFLFGPRQLLFRLFLRRSDAGLGMQRLRGFFVERRHSSLHIVDHNSEQCSRTIHTTQLPRRGARADVRCDPSAALENFLVQTCVKLDLAVAEVLVCRSELRGARGPPVSILDCAGRRRVAATDAVRIGSKSKKKPPTTPSPGNESRRRREGAAAPRDGEIRRWPPTPRPLLFTPFRLEVLDPPFYSRVRPP